MRRKVVKHGEATLTVSLPAKWVKQHKIKQGDEVEVFEKASQLVVTKDFSLEERSAQLSFSLENKRYVRSYLGRLYRQGYSNIQVNYGSPEILVRIKEAINNLLGAEIIDSSSTQCSIKIFSVGELEINFDQSLIKMLMALKCMFEIVKDEIKEETFNQENSLNEFRDNNWKLKDLILRSAALKNINYELFNSLCHLTFCYEKVGTKLLGYYKYHLKNRKIIRKQDAILQIKDILSALGWLIKGCSRKESFGIEEETTYRNKFLKSNVDLLLKKSSFSKLSYLVLELLDSTVSYLSEYKQLKY